MTFFRSPVRRPVRQKSGFKVIGKSTGGECKVKKSMALLNIKTPFELVFTKSNVTVQPLFNGQIGMIAFGGYIFPDKPIKITGIISCKFNGEKLIETFEKECDSNKWSKFGVYQVIEIISDDMKIDNVECKIKIESKSNKVNVNFSGVNLGSVSSDYFRNNDVWNLFQQKTHIYLPEIFYFDHEKVFDVNPKNIDLSKFSDGRPFVLKSCNRCGRYLLIDIENERNTLSFSNHCLLKGGCKHSTFSSYKLKENNIKQIPSFIKAKMRGDFIKTTYGYQLECKSCKKFFVNAPLNPLRNSTQHREDSLRRRSIEVLVDYLLKKESIYHKFRLKENKEFDKYIWEKFGKKCFKCKKDLQSPNDMDLDHTMPLSALWPLDKTATCLCKKCNSEKHDKFPIDFYTKSELDRLLKLTSLKRDILFSKKINEAVLHKLIENIEWFFDKFLRNKDCQKVREGKKTSDLIFYAIQKQINNSGLGIDLIKMYKAKTKHYPASITITSKERGKYGR